MIKDYFKADIELIGQLIEKDALRYTQSNVPVLITVFNVPGKNNVEQLIKVVFKGEGAEQVDKQPLHRFFMINGALSEEQEKEEAKRLPAISIIAKSLVQVPEVTEGVIRCRIVGRLTKDPKLITKTNDFEFLRFSLAVNMAGKSKPLFVDFSVFKPALIAGVQSDTKKGDSVYCAGEMAFYFVGESKTPTYSVKLDKLTHFK